ncbi:hypothetical protein HQ45_01300 [Porphyromonas crevioricanis]|uniref:LysM domain-containing protein n=1 Tax=Porphyromonas crevioricanis TaxID=393921 RepID=A0AB34PH57_9PORP|nr:hypothetical protein HQ45_01300 [Porphyromonas crevioricanis]KGN93969.1 hypothetical protein HQ38_07095 [Porphyromonas crevioricanis]GAD06942.1 LysM-repeat proteins and domains [Porphyromonas crevioricanis JCM 13913]
MLLCFCILGGFVQQAEAQSSKYTVKPEDTIYGLARRYHTTQEEIYRLNPSLASRGLRAGEVIVLPDGKNTANSTSSAQLSNGGKYIKHRIARGETLTAIARQYGVSVADILKINPEISADRYPEGFILLLPGGTSTSHNDRVRNQAESVPETNIFHNPISLGRGRVDTLRVSVILPLGKNAPERYVLFFEGFLMGINDLKKSGISTILHAYDADGSSEVDRICHSGALLGEHLVIGGSSDAEISKLANYARQHRLNYVVPFNSQISDDASFSSLFKLNPKQESLYPMICKEFVRRYSGYTVIIAAVSPDEQEDPLITPLEAAIRQAGIACHRRKVEDLGSLDSRTLVLPRSSSGRGLQTLLSQLETSRSRCKIFGYPEWQAQNKQTLEKLAKYETTFYSSFFFDPSDIESSLFLKKYNAWYNHRLVESFPRYNVLGYDVARYFVRATASYGMDFYNYLAQIPSDGLQSDFHFVRPKGSSLFINGNVYFVTLRAGQNPLRESIF